jgi:hypothetical protein
MRARPILLVAATLLVAFAAQSAEAFPWPWNRKGHKKSFPKAIDNPIVRPKAREDHKRDKARHARGKKYDDPAWGAKWEQIYDTKRKHEPHPWVTGRDE